MTRKNDNEKEALHEEVNLEELRRQHPEQRTLHGHAWRQSGPMIQCKSCPVAHSFWVGINKRMTGIDRSGEPILEDV